MSRGLLALSLRGIAGQAGQALATLLVTLAVSRALAPSERGAFVLLTLIPQVGVYVASAGIPAAVLRTVARSPEERPAALGLALATAAAVSAALTAAAAPLTSVFGGVELPSLLLVAIANAGFCTVVMVCWVSFGLERYLVAGAFRAAPLAATALAVWTSDAAGRLTAADAYTLWGAAHAVAAAVAVPAFARRLGLRLPSRTTLRASLRYGLSFYGNQLSQLLALRVDLWLLGWLGTVTQVGLYSLAASLSEATLLIATALGVVVFASSSRGSSEREFWRHLAAAMTTTAALAIVLWLAAPAVIRIAIGPSYLDAVEPLRILLLGAPGLVALRMTTNRLAGVGLPGRSSICAATALASTAALDLVLIPSHGMLGAAVASSVGYSAGGVHGLIELRARGGSRTASEVVTDARA